MGVESTIMIGIFCSLFVAAVSGTVLPKKKPPYNHPRIAPVSEPVIGQGRAL
jgi:hypothetical protein